MSKFWIKLKKVIKYLLNWRFLISFGIAWMITNGWSYVMLGVGIGLKIKWMITVASSYIAFLYLPFTAEKLVTIPLAILICKILFPKQKKLQDDLKAMLSEEKQKKGGKKNGRFNNNAKNERKSNT